jgi:hypothetical protein
MANKLGSENIFPIIRILEDATPPSTPPTGQVHFYVDEATKTLHGLDDAAVDTDYGASAITDIVNIPTAETDDTLVLAPDGAGGVEFRAGAGGAVATDAIWDAAGDLAVGSGANTAARLAAGSEGEVLTIASGVPSWEAASGGGGDYELVSESVLGSAAADITITGIPNTYKDLVLIGMARSAQTGSEVSTLRVRVGDGSIDTGSNYGFYRAIHGYGAATNGNLSGFSYAECAICASADSGSDVFGTFEIVIPSYRDTGKHKQFMVRSTVFGDAEFYNLWGGGVWRNAAAEIDQVRVYVDGFNLATGSKLAVYGRG